MCEKNILAKRSFQLDQHLKTTSHISKKYQRSDHSKMQMILTTQWRSFSDKEMKKSKEKNDFGLDFCQVMIGNNVSLNNLNNPNFNFQTKPSEQISH